LSSVSTRRRTSRACFAGRGAWAVEGFRAEIAHKRLYLNVPYFSDLGRFVEIDRTRDPEEPAHFLFPGALILRKDVDLLVQALVRLVMDGIEAKLTIMGSGELEAALKNSIRRVSERVEFVGFKKWEELPKFYARCHVLCAPSRYDGWGMIVPEGLASGMPVIATDSMGAALDLITNKNGWLVRAGDVDSLFVAVKHAATQSRSARIATAGIARQSVLRQDLDAGVARVQEAVAQSIAECTRLGLTA
jgi:glycosyltransferase involved in cell wall biosynthesis